MPGPADSTHDAPDEQVIRRSLTVVHSADASLLGQVYPIGEGLCIGRQAHEKVDIAIDDRLLSRRHATIAPVGSSGVHELIDHDSRNGSFVDGVRVQRSHLSEGTILRLGVTLFELTREAEASSPESGVTAGHEAFLGRSTAFRELLDRLADVVARESPVVLVGEPGAGKTAAAGYLHHLRFRRDADPASKRADTPIVTVSCGSGSKLRVVDLIGGLPPGEDDPIEGFLQRATGGTLVLDELDLLEPALQQALLTLITEGEITPVGGSEPVPLAAKVVATTCANLDAAVEAGVFSRELNKALVDCSIDVPPLRSRRSDIPGMARHFLRLEEPSRRFDWSATFLEKLLLYDWPMNVRELRTVMRRLTMVEEEVSTLRSAHLPKDIRRRVRMPSEDQLRASAVEVHIVPSRNELHEMLERHAGDVQMVADHYAKDRRHVYKWLTRHDLSVKDYRKS